MFLIPVLVMEQPAKPTEAQKIDAIIHVLEDLKDAQFIRNGSAYNATEAAAHLRMKWKNVGRAVKTAPDFIRLCGSGSSMSSKPYLIRYKDGHEVKASDFLWTELKKLERGDGKNPKS
ncbi:MAG: DUF5329 family protein [Holophagaceae bacterium]|nr:DUF5329 family protein [Holophagaceae bacterium]